MNRCSVYHPEADMDSESSSALAGDDKMRAGTAVRLAGVLDLASTDDLDRRLEDVIDRAGVGDVTLDFDAVTFMDATAVRAVVQAARHGQARGVTVVMRNLHPLHRRLFDVSGDAAQLNFGD